jgi:hypothetical protein
MEKFFNLFANSKIPTLLVIALFFYSGVSLIQNPIFLSPGGISGSILLCIGTVLGFIFFVDYRYKEQSEHVITQQAKAIDALGKALKSTSETHSKFEKNTQETLGSGTRNTIGREGEKQYTVGGSPETHTA